jgi:hypothetical protein
VEKRKRRAAKFGTALVDDGLKPALTARELNKASRQDIEPMQQEGMPADAEIFEAGMHGHVIDTAFFACLSRCMNMHETAVEEPWHAQIYSVTPVGEYPGAAVAFCITVGHNVDTVACVCRSG